LPTAYKENTGPSLSAEPTLGATLTLTVDVKGSPTASLVVQTELDKYGTYSHQASYIASLPSLVIPFFEVGQPYRAFELEAGQIHIGRLVRNWGAIASSPAGMYILVFRKKVLVAVPEVGSKGISWVIEGETKRVISEEPLEIWQSEWVLTNRWQPLPAQLSLIADRLAALEEKLG
jgi:hypothetical protein